MVGGIGYSVNRNALVEKIKVVFQKTAIPLPKLEEDWNIFDIDPFTTFGLFNKGMLFINNCP